MPHKKNPDVFEIIRGRCNSIQNIAQNITLLTANLPSGYHRDLQLLKEKLFPAFQDLRDCIRMTALMISNMTVNEGILNSEEYRFLFSVEEVNKLVLQGVPFRDAYKKVGLDIQQGKFNPSQTVKHTHEGSIGNLCNQEIAKMMDAQQQSFSFQHVDNALKKLLQ